MTLTCHEVYVFAHDGTRRWFHRGPCSGGGGKTAQLYQGRIYSRDPVLGGLILDRDTGAEIGTFESLTPVAFDSDTMFTMAGAQNLCGSGGPYGTCTLRAIDLATGQLRWEFLGDGLLLTAPIVSNGVVYTGSWKGNLYGLDIATGQPVWHTNLHDNIPQGDEGSPSGPLTGLGTAQGYLIVPLFAQYRDIRLWAFSST